MMIFFLNKRENVPFVHDYWILLQEITQLVWTTIIQLAKYVDCYVDHAIKR